MMKRSFAAAALVVAALPFVVHAQQKEVKIGVIYDYTGPFAAGGSQAAALGTKIAIDMINEKGGVEGYKIVPIYADAQSKAEVAINEATRLLDQEKVDLIMGVYSSAHCVPMAQKVDAAKKFMWANVCTASSVFKGKNLRYVFRPQVHTDQFGAASCTFLNENAKAKLKKDPKDLKVAIIYEDGPYGAGVAQRQRGDMQGARHAGRAEGRLRGDRARSVEPGDQAAPRACRRDPAHRLQPGHHAVLAPGARAGPEVGSADRSRRGLRPDRQAARRHSARTSEYIFNVDPVAAQLLDPQDARARAGRADRRRWSSATRPRPRPTEVPPHVSMGFNQTWIFLTDVLPRAIKKHGGVDPEALRKAALETDIPDGGTIQGYGVKFFPPGHEMSGQNERSSPVVMQYIGGKTRSSGRRSAHREPVLPWPKARLRSDRAGDLPLAAKGATPLRASESR